MKKKSIGFLLLILLAFSCQKKEKSSKSEIIFSVNAYSFSDLLTASYPNKEQQLFSLMNLLDWFHYKKIKAIDPTGYFFPGYPDAPSDEYLKQFMEKANEYGIKISGTGIRNDFAHPDPEIRTQGVERAIAWLEVASKMNAPVLRCFAGKIQKDSNDDWETIAKRVIESIEQLIPYAKKFGVKIGIQNHGDVLRNAEQCIYILDKLDAEWVGLVVDTGHFHTDDPYSEIEKVIPYAVNWQIKEYTDGNVREEKMNYKKIVSIIKNGGYKGFVPVETLKRKNEAYLPFKRVEDMLEKLDQEMRLFNTTSK